MKTMSDTSEIIFSNYGIYDLGDNLELSLPNTLIKFQRISDNAFSYFRENSEGQIIEKYFHVSAHGNGKRIAYLVPKPCSVKAKKLCFFKT